MKLALSMLCENPLRRTGLTTLFHEFVSRSVRLFPDLSWVLFAGPNQDWTVADERVELVRSFPANDRLNRRLVADHFQVPAVAKQKRADALLTVGFVPARKCIPSVMQVFSLQHLDRNNRVGLAREMYRRWVMNFSWPKADLIITNSDFARSQIVGVSSAFSDRIVRSYEGLQHEQFNQTSPSGEVEDLREKFGIQSGYLLWISNFYPYKQADLLITAYSRLPADFRRRHPLVMVGGEWEGTLAVARRQVNELGLADDVRFLNWVDDRWLAPLYRHARAFVLASREETFGRCVIEAMACGTPCIVNDIPIMHEVAGEYASILDFRNGAAVAEALQRVIEDGPQRSKLIAGGLKQVQQFTFERLATERIGAIREMLKKRAR